jgi:hypothetical protein
MICESNDRWECETAYAYLNIPNIKQISTFDLTYAVKCRLANPQKVSSENPTIAYKKETSAFISTCKSTDTGFKKL